MNEWIFNWFFLEIFFFIIILIVEYALLFFLSIISFEKKKSCLTLLLVLSEVSKYYISARMRCRSDNGITMAHCAAWCSTFSMNLVYDKSLLGSTFRQLQFPSHLRSLVKVAKKSSCDMHLVLRKATALLLKVCFGDQTSEQCYSLLLTWPPERWKTCWFYIC